MDKRPARSQRCPDADWAGPEPARAGSASQITGSRWRAAVRRQQRLGHLRQPHRQRQAAAGGRPAHWLLGAGGLVRGAPERRRALSCTATSRRSTRWRCWVTTAQFGWSLTMFQNDDIDLIAEKVNPANPQPGLVPAASGSTCKAARKPSWSRVPPPVKLALRRSPHGPIITDAFRTTCGKTPVAMWWAFLETENPILDAFYELNRADTLDKARQAVEQDPCAGPERGVGQRQRRHRLVGGGQAADSPGRCQPDLHSRRQHRRGRQDRLLSASPTTRRKKTRSAATSCRPTTSPSRRSGVPVPGYYQPAGPRRSGWQACCSDDQPQVGYCQQPGDAARHAHRLRPAGAGAAAAGAAQRRHRSAGDETAGPVWQRGTAATAPSGIAPTLFSPAGV